MSPIGWVLWTEKQFSRSKGRRVFGIIVFRIQVWSGPTDSGLRNNAQGLGRKSGRNKHNSLGYSVKPGPTDSKRLAGHKLYPSPAFHVKHRQTSTSFEEISLWFKFPGFPSAYLCTQGLCSLYIFHGCFK